MDKPLRAFLSYPHSSDNELRDHVREVIDKLGIEVWDDVAELGPGADWRVAISSAIRAVDFVIAIVSSPSSWQGYEIGLAHGIGKPIIPVIDEAKHQTIPPEFAGRLAAFYSSERPADLERQLRFLVDGMKRRERLAS